jgi:hypothetical protein
LRSRLRENRNLDFAGGLPPSLEWAKLKRPKTVMPGLVPGIHELRAWMAGPSPAMTDKRAIQSEEIPT